MNTGYYKSLLQNGTVEVRCLDRHSDTAKKSRSGVAIWSGTYSQLAPLRAALRHGEQSGYDCYVTINPSRIPALNGRLRAFQRTTRDADIIRRMNIFFDFDPAEKNSEGAAKDDIGEAVSQARKLAEFLCNDYGWGTPTLANSGNGGHLLYLTDMNPDISLHGLYAGLERRFSTERVKFDVSVKNPSRIARAYGTTNRKGGAQSMCLFSYATTDESVILSTIERITPPKPARTWVNTPSEQPKEGGSKRGFDVRGWFSGAGLYLQPTRDPGKHWVRCPWADNHSFTGPTDSVIWEGEWPSFHCSHDGCANRDISDVVAVAG